MFNSIPVDMVATVPTPATSKTAAPKKVADEHAIDKATEDRIKTLLKYLKKYGVPDKYLFEVNELKDMTNIPKITRCIAMLGKMVRRIFIYCLFIEIFL
jgi:hypothetical protein